MVGARDEEEEGEETTACEDHNKRKRVKDLLAMMITAKRTCYDKRTAVVGS